MIVIVDYGAGNVASIRNMLRKAGFDSEISSSRETVLSASKLILPGVGHYDHGMHELHSRGLVDALNVRVKKDGVPILGICLGLQLFARRSEEGDLPGLGWIAADVKRFDTKRLGEALRVPHMGWADIDIVSSHPIFAGLPSMPRYYFVHSYHLACEAESDVAVRATHGYAFTAGVVHENICGVQFHPEKSHAFGLKLLENFARVP
jgi:glutamine amidotransferase